MKVKVYNDNVHPYTEDFRGKKISIPPKAYIEMEYDDAVTFQSSFSPIIRDADGNDMPEGYKMIRIDEPPVKFEAKANPLLCVACRYLAHSEKDLKEHSTAHSADTVTDAEAEAQMKRKAK
jgi:hypothetical protein